MKRLNALIAVCLFYSLSVCSELQAATSEKSPIGESGFAAKVTNQIMNLQKDGVSDLFSNDIPTIYYFAKYEYKLFSFRGVSQAKRYRVEWRAPDDKLYEKQQIGLAWGQNEFLFTDLKINGTAAAEKIGVWTVRLYEYDKLLDEKSFKLEPAGLREKKLKILSDVEMKKAADEAGNKISLSVSDIVDVSNPSVGLVIIVNENEKIIGTGSGFLIGSNGRFATNYHVINHAASGVVKFPGDKVYSIEHVVATDEVRDLAILKLDMTNAKFLSMGNLEFVKVGQPVIAIGSPFALANSVSAGIVSSIRDIDKTLKLIQTTTPISPGSSGGPLLDYDGKAIGITSMGVNPAMGQNINFAVPINYLRDLDRNPRAGRNLSVNKNLREKLKGFQQVVNKVAKR